MFDLAHWLLFLHIVAALWLAAGAIAGAVVRAQTRRAGSLAERVMGLRIAWRLVNVLALPGSVVTGLLGIALIYPRGWSMRAGWIHASLALWIVALAAGLFYLRPNLRRLLAAAEASLAAGAPSEELKRLAAASGPRIVADLNLVALILLTLLMVFRPF